MFILRVSAVARLHHLIGLVVVSFLYCAHHAMQLLASTYAYLCTGN